MKDWLIGGSSCNEKYLNENVKDNKYSNSDNNTINSVYTINVLVSKNPKKEKPGLGKYEEARFANDSKQEFVRILKKGDIVDTPIQRIKGFGMMIKDRAVPYIAFPEAEMCKLCNNNKVERKDWCSPKCLKVVCSKCGLYGHTNNFCHNSK